MRAAAGLAVKSFDFDGAENSFAFHFLANARFGQLFSRAEADHHRAIFENDFVGAALGFFQMAREDAGRVEINRGNFLAQMERDSLKSEKLDECGGEQMLRGVLLHVVNAARPIHVAVDGPGRNFSGGVVNDVVIRRRPAALVRIQNFHYRHVAQLAEIVRLAAGGGVKGGLVQYHAPAVAFALARDHLRVEFPQKRIAIIEPVRQVSSLSYEKQDSIVAETAKSAARSARTR